MNQLQALTIALSALLLSACGSPTFQPNAQNTPAQVQGLNAPKQAVSALSGLPIALEQIKQVDATAQLYEIDVWQEAKGKSLHYGFLPAGQSQGEALRVVIDVASQQVSVENKAQATQVQPVNQSHWKLDSEAIYARAQQNGLRDQTYLATLWGSTWHISGLKHNLYFQMDSQNGAIQLRCIGPYLNNCTGADGTPVQRVQQDAGWQAHTSQRQSAR